MRYAFIHIYVYKFPRSNSSVFTNSVFVVNLENITTTNNKNELPLFNAYLVNG